MRRWILGVLLVLMGLLIAASVMAGYQIESRLAHQLQQLDERLDGVQFVSVNVDRGWFSTAAEWSVIGLPDGEAVARMRLDHGLTALPGGQWLSLEGQLENRVDRTRLYSTFSAGLGLMLGTDLRVDLISDVFSGQLTAASDWGLKQGTVRMHDVSLRPHDNLAVDGLNVELRFERAIESTFALRLQADRMAFVSGSVQVIREPLVMLDSRATEDRADLQVQATAAFWRQGQSQLDSLNYQSITRQINLVALGTVRDALLELRRQGYPSEVIGQQMRSYLFLAIPELLRVQPSHELVELSWVESAGAVGMQGQIGLTAQPQGAFISEPERLLAVLDADALVMAPESVWRRWLERYYAMRAPEWSELERRSLIEQQLDQYQMRDTGRDARVRIEYDQQQLRINSRPVIRSADWDRPAEPS